VTSSPRQLPAGILLGLRRCRRDKERPDVLIEAPERFRLGVRDARRAGSSHRDHEQGRH
jgi:hypothetical protein